jgi:Allantoicase repeat
MNTEVKQEWPDLAGRALGGSVIFANDELFAERENLIKPEEPVFRRHTFGHKGQIMDGWETRRRRDPAGDGQGDSARPAGLRRRGPPGRGRHVLLHRQLPARGVG